MTNQLRFGIFLLLAAGWLAGCGAQPASMSRGSPPTQSPPPISVQPDTSPTSTSISHQTDSIPSVAPTSLPATHLPRLLTFADSDQTITLRVGEPFDLELGPSAGSDWQIRMSEPDILEPPIHELGPQGSRIVLEAAKSGETIISANSHAICEHPGPCPEVFQYFTLKIKVLAQ